MNAPGIYTDGNPVNDAPPIANSFHTDNHPVNHVPPIVYGMYTDNHPVNSGPLIPAGIQARLDRGPGSSDIGVWGTWFVNSAGWTEYYPHDPRERQYWYSEEFMRLHLDEWFPGWLLNTESHPGYEWWQGKEPPPESDEEEFVPPQWAIENGLVPGQEPKRKEPAVDEKQTSKEPEVNEKTDSEIVDDDYEARAAIAAALGESPPRRAPASLPKPVTPPAPVTKPVSAAASAPKRPPMTDAEQVAAANLLAKKYERIISREKRNENFKRPASVALEDYLDEEDLKPKKTKQELEKEAAQEAKHKEKLEKDFQLTLFAKEGDSKRKAQNKIRKFEELRSEELLKKTEEKWLPRKWMMDKVHEHDG